MHPLGTIPAGVFAMCILAALPATGAQVPVPIDMSAVFNYDSVGETGEKQYSAWFRAYDPISGVNTGSNKASTAYHTMGGYPTITASHGVGQYENNGRTWVSQAQANADGAGKIGLPTDYKIGEFEIGVGLTPPEGYTRYGKAAWVDPGVYPTGVGTESGPNRVNQTLSISRSSKTIDLIEAQKGKYGSLNLLFSGWRGTSAYTYTTRIEAKYAEDASFTTVWQDARTVTASAVGGTLASMGNPLSTDGTWEDADGVDTNTFGTDGYPVVKPVAAFMATRTASNAGSPAYWNVANANRYLWTLDSDPALEGNQGIALDTTKTLEAIRITTAGGTSNRLYVYGISATLAPSSTVTVLTVR